MSIGPPGGQLLADDDGFFGRGQRHVPPALASQPVCQVVQRPGEVAAERAQGRRIQLIEFRCAGPPISSTGDRMLRTRSSRMVRRELPGGHICTLASVPSSGGRPGAGRPLLHLACVLTRREGRAAQKRAELAVSFDQRPLTTPWADLNRGVTVAGDGHVGVFEEFDDERGHLSRVGDKHDRPACPGQRHVEKAAFLGVREGFGRGHGQVEHGVVGDCAREPVRAGGHAGNHDVVGLEPLGAVHGAERDVQVCRRVLGEDVALEPVAPENVDADRAVAAARDAAACDSSGQIVEVGGQRVGGVVGSNDRDGRCRDLGARTASAC